MKRLLVVFAACALGWVTGCSGGGSSTVVTPPPPVGFNNASLKGTYVFSMTGTTVDNALGESAFSRVGTFIADGKGDIATTGGIEDVHIFGQDQPFAINGGNYVVNADGRGTLSLLEGATTVQYSISLVASTSGYIVATGTGSGQTLADTETASGSFTLQTATTLATGTYVFDFSGIAPDGTGNPVSIVGDFIPNSATGSGSFSAGSFEDINEAGNVIPKTSISGGSYATDSTNPGTGRGLATIGGLDYVYYVVDGQHAQFMGIDNDAAAPGTILGEAVAQQAGTPNTVTAFNNSGFVFVMGGSGEGVPITRGGRFTANGGSLTSILTDYNDGGTVKSIPVVNAGTITLDGDNSGRGTIVYTDSATTYNWVFYLSSATQGVIQDDSNPNITIDGSLLGQTGAPFSSGSLATNYAFNWSGADTIAEQDFVGSFAPASATPDGKVDFNIFGQQKLFLNNLFNGVITIGGDGTGTTRSTFVAGINGTPMATYNYFAYIASPGTILVLGTDTTRVMAGVLTAQTP
jgi:hypothetical protein